MNPSPRPRISFDLAISLIALFIIFTPSTHAAFFTMIRTAWAAVTNITGSGSVNTVAAFSGTNSIGNSMIYDNGTSVGIGAGSTPHDRLEIAGSSDSLLRLTRIGASTPTIFREGTDGAMVITNGGQDTITLKGGSVGVGTTNPGQKLDVNGVINASNVMITGGTNGAFFAKDRSDNTKSSAFYRQGGLTRIWDSTAGDRMVIDVNGNVGIGTTNPGQKLDVAGNIKGTQLCIGSDCRSSWPIIPPTPDLQKVTDVGNSTTRDITAKAIYTNDWFRVNGANGIYWQDYAGGWQMTDSTWLRAYGGKSVYTTAQVRADTGFCIGGDCISSWPTTPPTPNFQQVTDVGNSTTRDITAKAIYTNDWFRVNGANGIYWQDYAGGWQMTDSTYIRSYNSKPVLLPYLVDQDNTDYYLNPNGTSRLDYPYVNNLYSYGAVVGNTISANSTIYAGSAIYTTGVNGGFFIKDRNGRDNYTAFYRDGELTRIWDSTGGDRMVIDANTGNVSIAGKTYTNGGLIIERRTSDPASPEDGQIWLRTDL